MMLRALIAATLLESVAAQGANSCHTKPDCQSCVIQPNCGWCATNTTFPTQVGPQCVDFHETFDCDQQFQTDTCQAGWKCEGSGNSSQCVPSPGGIADKSQCEASCKKPPPPPPTPPKPPPTPKQAYKCDNTTYTCSPAPFGEPSMQTCQEHCKVSYQCDDAAKQCKQADPSAPGKHYDDKTTCDSVCPATPQPTPYEIRGIWRGLAIHQNYKSGEWIANITADSLAIWYPTATGWELYMRGNCSSIRPSASNEFVLIIDSVAGKLKGLVHMLGADFSMNPEVSGFLQLAVNEAAQAQEVADFDTGMLTATVLSFETCPTGGVPPPPVPPPPPPPGPPPPCKAKIDVMIILDGSASIVSSDWLKALDFTNKVIDGFNMSAQQAEIGIVQFSETATLEIGLSPDKAAVKAKVSNLPQMKLNTNTYAGFQTADNELKAHGRAGVNDTLVILLTDGMQNQGPPAKTIADAMKARKVTIFGIGVGPNIDEPELQSWCSTPLSTHYFKVSDWTALQKVLDQILADACPHPPPPPLFNPGDYCKFHLPANLPLTTTSQEIDALDVEVEPVVTKPVRVAPNVSDVCNMFPTCKECISSRTATGNTCGWCSGDLTYNGTASPSQYHCAGKDRGNSSSRWTCSGHFQTTSCDIPGDCGLKGAYRGLRIDNSYDFGEWTAKFTPSPAGPNGTSQGELVTIKKLDMAGNATTVVDGTIMCTKKCSNVSSVAGAEWVLTASTGTIYRGICGYTDQIQAETSGLMWAMSNKGVATAPQNFDTAMNSSNATVYTYYKCSEFKSQTCQFPTV